MKPQFHPLQVVIEKRCLVIRVGLETLIDATLPNFSEDADEYRVTNLADFGDDLLSSIEKDDAENLIELLDVAVLNMIEDGVGSIVDSSDPKFKHLESLDARQARK